MTQLMHTLTKDLPEAFKTARANPEKVYFPNFGDGDNIFRQGITINRVMFKIPGTDFEIYWYGFFIALGILLAMIYGFSRMKNTVGVDPDRATDVVIGGLIGAILGARLYYILFNSDMSITEFFDFRQGGLAFYGGLIGAVVVGGIIAKARKLKFTALLDIVAPCFFIGQAVGRWGNFFNQEAFGSSTDLPWGMMSNTTIQYLADNCPDISQKVPVHPCFLYESLWCILGFVLLHFYLKHRKFDGEVFLIYVGFYGLGRFFIEATRTDSLYLLNIKVSQLLAGTCVLASIVLIIIFRNIVKRNDDYKFFYQTELSKAQVAQYEKFDETRKVKAELKKKIKEAKASGESFVELQKEYDEKFGKNAKPEKFEVPEEKETTTNYKSILADEEDSADENIEENNEEE